jgi:hypothetical protein
LYCYPRRLGPTRLVDVSVVARQPALISLVPTLSSAIRKPPVHPSSGTLYHHAGTLTCDKY